MRIQAHIVVLVSALISAVAISAESSCEFENPDRRRISGDNPSDLACMKVRAANGDEYQQFYLGLILIGQVPGPTNIQEGLALLKQVAGRNNKYSANAMLSIGEVYRRPNSPIQNYALAYQWLYLASQQPPFRGTAFPLPDEELGKIINSERRKELERSAQSLLQER
jgi:hypothetical protein